MSHRKTYDTVTWLDDNINEYFLNVMDDNINEYFLNVMFNTHVLHNRCLQKWYYNYNGNLYGSLKQPCC